MDRTIGPCRSGSIAGADVNADDGIAGWTEQCWNRAVVEIPDEVRARARTAQGIEP